MFQKVSSLKGKQDNQDGLLAIYDQLDDARKNEVIDFAKFKLVEQNRSQIFTLAAHSDDPNKIVSDDDLNNINSALDEMDRKFDKK